MEPDHNMKTTQLLHGDSALAVALNSNVHTIRTLREKGIIPHIRTGHRSIIFDLTKVLAALDTLEIKAVTKKGVQ